MTNFTKRNLEYEEESATLISLTHKKITQPYTQKLSSHTLSIYLSVIFLLSLFASHEPKEEKNQATIFFPISTTTTTFFLVFFTGVGFIVLVSWENWAVHTTQHFCVTNTTTTITNIRRKYCTNQQRKKKGFTQTQPVFFYRENFCAVLKYNDFVLFFCRWTHSMHNFVSLSSS